VRPCEHAAQLLKPHPPLLRAVQQLQEQAELSAEARLSQQQALGQVDAELEELRGAWAAERQLLEEVEAAQGRRVQAAEQRAKGLLEVGSPSISAAIVLMHSQHEGGEGSLHGCLLTGCTAPQLMRLA
jgi:hypothetical protein